MPHHLNRIALAAWLMAALVIATATTSIVHASPSSGPNNGLCHPQSNRLSVAKDFILGACFDGQNLYLVNNTQLPLDVGADGSTGQPYQFPVGGIPAIPSLVFTYIDPADTGLIMPGYELRIPIGSGSADISVGGTNHNRSYLLVRALLEWLPTKGIAQVAQQIPQLTNELESVWTQYQDCVTRKGFFGKLGCDALYYRNVAFALSRFGIEAGVRIGAGSIGGAVQAAINTVLNLLDTAIWTAKNASDVTAFLHGTRTMHINPIAVATPGPTPTHAPQPKPTPTSSSSPTVSNPTVALAQGPLVSGGAYRYTVTLSGFPANVTVSVECYDSVSPSGFYNFSQSTDASGNGFTQSECYSGDGPDHWVVANGITSNHVQWGGTTISPPPVTYSETVGGDAHTWTNYSNAGGVQGPTIPAYQTVQIACKVTGFRVSDGNTWWYRIASAPWSNNYYVSADAFYNNGATSGPLKGTPFVDPAVSDC